MTTELLLCALGLAALLLANIVLGWIGNGRTLTMLGSVLTKLDPVHERMERLRVDHIDLAEEHRALEKDHISWVRIVKRHEERHDESDSRHVEHSMKFDDHAVRIKTLEKHIGVPK